MDNNSESIAKNLVRSILKSKKLIQIYPSNNVIYRASVDEVYGIVSNYLEAFGRITLGIKATGIFIDSEEVYHSDEKLDNLALYFFKEGVREIVFMEGLTKKELEEFLLILGSDFGREDRGEDFLIATWERDFESIKIVVDDMFLVDYQDQQVEDDGLTFNMGDIGTPVNMFGGSASEEIRQNEDSAKSQEEVQLESAYRDSLDKDASLPHSIEDLSVGERAFIMSEMQKDPAEQIDKLSEILIHILLYERDTGIADRIFRCFEHVILYSLRGGSINTLLSILKRLKEIERQFNNDSALVSDVRQLMLFCISKKPLELIGDIIDNSKDIKEEDLIEYAWYFGGDAISPLITLLEGLQTMRGRRMVNNVLIHIGKENLDAIIARLSDPLWYVVRNVIYVLRGIGDIKAQEGILGVLGHEHPRVRLEALKSMQDFKSIKVLQEIKKLFDDSDSLVRLTAVSVMGNLARENHEANLYARDAIMDKILDGGFDDRDFREKKAFYEALVNVADETVEQFMLATLKKKSMFGGRKQIESRACAAHYLGLAGSRAALSELEPLMKSSDLLLMEHAAVAVQRLRHE
jgi:HEAT repeat protein